MQPNRYADRRALDGVVAEGWRYVKKGGRVKFGGTYYTAPKLNEIIGEYVKVYMDDYWQQEISVFTGRVGCISWFCKAFPKG